MNEISTTVFLQCYVFSNGISIFTNVKSRATKIEEKQTENSSSPAEFFQSQK